MGTECRYGSTSIIYDMQFHIVLIRYNLLLILPKQNLSIYQLGRQLTAMPKDTQTRNVMYIVRRLRDTTVAFTASVLSGSY